MNKSDLKPGFIVVMANKKVYTVKDEYELIPVYGDGHIGLGVYNDNLKDKNYPSWDIVGVYQPIFIREIPKITMQDVYEKFGYEVEIV